MSDPQEDVHADQLKRFIDRIERMEKDKTDIAEDIRDIYMEAKSQGYDPKVMREIIKIRKTDPNDLDEYEAMLHLYKQAMGMLPAPAG